MMALANRATRWTRGLGLGVTLAMASTAFAAPNLTNLLTRLSNTPAGSWVRVNLNDYSSVWAPAELQPLPYAGPTAPQAIINAWSSFAWDSNRGDLILFGGGHANYGGNEVYRWHGTNQLWERASVPSEVVSADGQATYLTIDGALNAPISSHTYDNQLFLPQLDRFLTFGGAAFNTGSAFPIKMPDGSLRATGPYFWDPARGDPNKVGGTTGSHVKRIAPHPEILGGQMWQDRDLFSGQVPLAYVSVFINTVSAYASEKGLDTVYQTAGSKLFRYQATNVSDPTSDTWEPVGAIFSGFNSYQGAGAYDPNRKIFLRTGNLITPFAYWDLQLPGPNNADVLVSSINDPSGVFQMSVNFGLDYDADRRVFVAWGGGAQVWEIQPPATLSPSGWNVALQPSSVGAVPDVDVGTGVLGKFKYIPNLHAFMALQNTFQGNIWLYKPVGWTMPGPENQPPTVTITAPANGASIAMGTQFSISAAASDADGGVTSVEFYRNGALIATAAAAPYSVIDSVPLAGNYVYTARAFDNSGNVTISSPVSLAISSVGSASVTLQEVAGTYAGTRDTYLDPYNTNSAGGGVNAQLVNVTGTDYSDLVRFAIFRSEGGPVPDGATITAATLGLYKNSYYDYVYQVKRILHDWSEGQATWNQAKIGVPWAVGGANGVGTDVASAMDAQAVASYNPGPVNFNVTAAVQAMAQTGSNFGWRVVPISGNGNLKTFVARESSVVAFRPKLAISYVANSTSNVPPTVDLTSPIANASFTAPANVVLTATAQDADGTVSSVEFYRDGILVATDNFSPYTITDINVAIGAHSYSAKAFDNGGAATTSAPKAVTVNPTTNQAPTVSLTAPVAGISYTAPASIAVAATAADPDGNVTSVEFYRDGVLLTAVGAAPFTFTDSNVLAGSHSYTAKAFDNGGLSATSAAVSVSVTPPANVPPTVNITAPTAGATFNAPASISVTANALDSDGTVSSVEFYRNGTLFATDMTAPFTVIDANLGANNYSYSAKAFDNAGMSTMSAAVSVVVNVSSSGTVTLQDVAGGYGGTRDSYTDPFNPDYTGWATKPELLNSTGPSYADFVRFAIYQTEGGPVPNGATITSAILTLNKTSYYDYSYQVKRVLRDWVETQVTWNQARTGIAWSVAGANGAGTDIAVAADAQASAGWTPGPVNFDVTAAVQAMAQSVANFGWRVVPIAGNANLKTFAAREYTTSTLRPKLVISYTTGSGNTPPTVSLTAPTGLQVFGPAPANIVVTADAQDAEGPVARVEFYRDGSAIPFAIDTVAPFSVVDSGVPAGGPYSYAAKAIDAAGASTTSAAVAVTVVAAVNQAPTVSLTAPSVSAQFTAPANIVVTANALDADGVVTRVEFYRDGVLFATDSATPFSVTDTSVPVGNPTYTAKAFDNLGALTTSLGVTVAVIGGGGGTVTLQNVASGYAGTRDTYLDPYNPAYAGWATREVLLNTTGPSYANLVRFAIYQSEGGPVPNGATITSATLTLHKTSAYDYLYQLRRVLRDWVDGQATWNQARIGVAWSVPGANGAGTDIAAVVDAQASAGWAPGPIDFDVTAAVQTMSLSGANFGWRVLPISGNGNSKTFASSEYTVAPLQRPKLVITYTP